MPRLEVGDRGLGVGAVIAAPAQTVAEAGERALNRLRPRCPDRRNAKSDRQRSQRCSARRHPLPGVAVAPNRLRREFAGPCGELDAVDQRPHPSVPGDPILHAVGPARRARITEIDGARDRQDVVAIGEGVQPAFGPFAKRGLERVLSCEHEIGLAFEINAAFLPHAAIIGAASGLQQPAAAVAKAVARLDIAELPGLSRIAETVDALCDRFRPVRQRLRLARRDGSGMAARAKYLQEAPGAVAHVLPIDLERAAFVQDLRKKMRQASRRGHAMGDQQRVALLERGDVGWPRLRRDSTNHVNGARHAILSRRRIYFVLESASWSATCVASPAQPSATSPCVSWNCFTAAWVMGAILAVHVERRIGAEHVECGLQPLRPDRIEHGRSGRGRRKLVVNLGEQLLADLRQDGKEVTGMLLDRLHCRHAGPNGLLDLRGDVDEPKDDWQEANKLFHERLLVVGRSGRSIRCGRGQPVMLLGLVSRRWLQSDGIPYFWMVATKRSCHGPCFGKPSPLVSIVLCKRERITSERVLGHLNWNFAACSLKYSMRRSSRATSSGCIGRRMLSSRGAAIIAQFGGVRA